MDLKRIKPSTLISQKLITSLPVPPHGTVIVESIGICRGIEVRSRNLVANIGASFQSLAGGSISTWVTLCEDVRQVAYNKMVEHCVQLGGNAILGVRYDSCELNPGITEVLCYGTAVVVASEKQ